MTKINIKLMSDVTFATLKQNIDTYENYFIEYQENGNWINNITVEKAFDTKKYQIEDFELIVPKSPSDRETDLKNGIILYEHLNTLPNYILSEPKFWLWIMFEKAYKASLKSMEKIDVKSIKHQWLFIDGQRRGMFFGVISRLFYRVKLTYSPENNEDPYYLARFVMENPQRFREITWRAISNYDFVVKSMLRAEMRANENIEFKENSNLFTALAKEISKLGSIKFIDVMEEKDLEDYIYDKYKEIINNDIEKKKIDDFNYAIDLMNTDKITNIEKAITIFEKLDDFMDSKKMIENCDNKLRDILKPKKSVFSIFGLNKHE